MDSWSGDDNSYLPNVESTRPQTMWYSKCTMGIDAIYKHKDDGIPYRELNPGLAKQIIEDQARG